MTMRSGKKLYAAILAGALAACAPAGSNDPERADAVAEAAGALVEGGRNAVAYDFAERANMPHGITGDEALVFVTEPLNGRVAVTDRFTGEEVAVVPAPPDGFLLPFAVRLRETGRLVVLDSGGFPSPVAPAIPRIYDYDYTWDAKSRTFSATLARSVIFAGLPVIYAEDIEVLDDGRTVMSESILGALWVVRADGTIVPGIMPAGFAPDQAVPGLNPCFMPATVTADGIPFATAGNFAPGVGSMAQRGGYLYFGNTCLGGVRRVPLASLEDPTRAPWDRGADIEVVSARPAGTPVEAIKGLTFNKWDAEDGRLVATDTLQMRLIRIDVNTGAREVLADDPVLFNFAVAAQFLPPVRGRQPIVVASDQEHRLAMLNAAISEDQFRPPFLLTKVYAKH